MASLTQHTTVIDGAPQGVSQAIKTIENAFLAGNSTAALQPEGNINVQMSATGVTCNGITGSDVVLAVYAIPASAFDAAGRGVTVTASGSFAATGNNKRVKLIVNATTAVVGAAVTGGTVVCDSGTVATNNQGWTLAGSLFKYGAAGSNTQMGIHNQALCGAAVSAQLAPSLVTATESGAILIAVTGNAATAATDIIFNYLEVNWTN